MNRLFVGHVPEAGLNPYLCEIANIRDIVLGCMIKEEATTRKAVDIVRSLVEKVKAESSTESDTGSYY